MEIEQEEVGGWQAHDCCRLAMKCFGCHWVGQSSLYISNTCISHLVRTQFVALKAVWDLNQCLLYGHNPKCYNIVNECSYRIMSVFRMAASDLSPDFKSNLAPIEIYMVCWYESIKLTVYTPCFNVRSTKYIHNDFAIWMAGCSGALRHDYCT